MRALLSIALAALLLAAITALVVAGYCIHLRLGGEALGAWGGYLTGSATLLLAVAAIIAGFVGGRDYRAKVVAEKAKWLLQLYEKLFENANYKDVRRKLDYDDTEEIEALIKADGEGRKFTESQQVVFDQFTDYLNLFEMVARLRAIKQLTSEDIKATFDYYLRLLTEKRNPVIREYLKKEGFENLDKLLKEYEN